VKQQCKEVWGIIPARGGSKSIPYKNLVEIGGKTLIERAVTTARASKYVSRIILSTDDLLIANHGKELGIEVHRRPESLAKDDTPVDRVLINLLNDWDIQESENAPTLITLLQVTSPFIRPEDIDSSISSLLETSEYQSAQTVSECQHNSHAMNQRKMEDNRVTFAFADARKKLYNKQKKPIRYTFGNVVSVRTEALLRGEGVFAEPSCGVVIPYLYSFDLDRPEDIPVAEALVDLVD
jgi:CMP-N,N'-diacetyllegionaminic acid synthase